MAHPIQNKQIRSRFQKSVKTETICFRCSTAQKSQIKRAAKSVKTSMTDYLLSLHDIATGEG